MLDPTPLLEAARHHVITTKERDEQRISFAHGNVAISNPRVTREIIELSVAELRRRAGTDGT
ncbi:MAG: hypothetical protein AAB726_01525 [Patescibacteria group bacterium]